MSGRVFSLPLAITGSDIDEFGHVNNAVDLRWGQEAAIGHWRSLANAEQATQFIWVVIRHEIDYRTPIYAGDRVEARTWVDEAGPRGPLWGRHVTIGKPGEKPTAEIKSTWCMLDVLSRRPRRVAAELAAMFLESRPNPVDRR